MNTQLDNPVTLTRVGSGVLCARITLGDYQAVGEYTLALQRCIRPLAAAYYDLVAHLPAPLTEADKQYRLGEYIRFGMSAHTARAILSAHPVRSDKE